MSEAEAGQGDATVKRSVWRSRDRTRLSGGTFSAGPWRGGTSSKSQASDMCHSYSAVSQMSLKCDVASGHRSFAMAEYDKDRPFDSRNGPSCPVSLN